jgi:hypothetical protein
MMPKTDEVLECGHPESPHGDYTRGYGVDAQGNRSCYACCKASLVAEMEVTGKTTLYFNGWEVSDWPGMFKVPAYDIRKGTHRTFGGLNSRYDFRFAGPDGYVWRGTQRGDNNMIARCARTKTTIA